MFNNSHEGDWRDLNPQPPGPQPGALPVELQPPFEGLYKQSASASIRKIMDYVVTIATKPSEIVQLVICSVFVFMVYHNDPLVDCGTKFALYLLPRPLHDVSI